MSRFVDLQETEAAEEVLAKVLGPMERLRDAIVKSMASPENKGRAVDMLRDFADLANETASVVEGPLA